MDSYLLIREVLRLLSQKNIKGIKVIEITNNIKDTKDTKGIFTIHAHLHGALDDLGALDVFPPILPNTLLHYYLVPITYNP